MNFEFQQTLDFVNERNTKRSMKYCENRKKKRRIYYQQATNQSLGFISASPSHVDSQTMQTTNDESDILLEKLKEENLLELQQQVSFQNTNGIENTHICKLESIDNLYDDFKCSDDLQTDHENLLHLYTNISIKEFCCQLLTLLRKSNICKSHANHLLSFINSVLPIPHNAPKKLDDVLNQLEIENNVFTKYKLCVNCNSYLSERQEFCYKCSVNDIKTFAFIYDMNIEEQIRNIYIRLQAEIKQYQNQFRLMIDNDQTNDIGYNTIYQQLLKKNVNENFITFILHIDGISLAKSSKLKMWLFSGSIVELRPQLRKRRYNNVIFSFWFGYKEPDTTTWLANCVNLIKLIKRKGILINETHRIDIKFLSITGDSPALSKVLNFNGHGGYHCCYFCYIRGVTVGRKRQYFYEKTMVIRDVEKYSKQSIQADRNKEQIYGHKGISILQDILDVAFPYVILIDYQHATLLRHTKTVLSYIYHKQMKPSNREQLDSTLKSQQFPHFFHRKMKPFQEFSFIKAVELRNILFYGFLPLSLEFVNNHQLAHLALFICSIRLYHSQPPIFGNNTGQIAHKLFEYYYKDHDLFYNGIQNHVLHLQRHFDVQYQNYGSLANIGCFHQEDLIGHLSKNIHGSNYYASLIVHYFSIDSALHVRNSWTEDRIECKPIDIDINVIASNYPAIIEYHERICRCSNSLTCISIYRRCLINNRMFHSLIYKKKGKSNSYFISYNKSTTGDIKYFGRIMLFFSCVNRTYAVVQRYTQIRSFSHLFKSSPYFFLLEKPLDNLFFLLSKEPSDLQDIVDVDYVSKHCIVFEILEQLVVTEVSAYYEHD